MAPIWVLASDTSTLSVRTLNLDAQGTETLYMPVYSWLCRTELDRERMVATVRWVGPARVAMFAILTVVLIGSARDTGWLPLVPLFICAVGSIALYRNLERRRRPEFWAAGGWLVTQAMLGVGIAITGGPRSPALPWLAVAVISLIARFSRTGIVVGLIVLVLELAAVTFGVRPEEVWHHPSEFLAPFGLLFCVGIFAAAQMRSDLDHRDYDKVTKLPNAAKFIDDLRLALVRRVRRGGAISVLAIDLDGFRLANEGLGPQAGDALLREAGNRIVRGAARAADSVARRSADEFLVFLSDLGGEHAVPGPGAGSTPRQRAQAVARAIQAQFEAPFEVGEEEVYLDASVGIAILESGEEDAGSASERLLGEAQEALSGARSAGRGNLMFFDHDRSTSRSQLTLVSHLRKAIERGQFEMRYQPTVNLHTGRLVGVEALLRWRDPNRGLISPAEFIPVLEDTGMIEPVGMWAFAEVCRQAREWQRAGHYFDVAFNLSPRELHQPDLLKRMFGTIERTAVEAKSLVIEITESTALRDPERATELSSAMTQRGLRLAIDDFGVGLSSLSRLRDMPASLLKIDRSFISDMESSPSGLTMVRTIIQLAETLGMQPHAEGVENEQQRKILLESGCSIGQGFLFSRPVPADTVLSYDFGSRQAELVPLPGAGRRFALPA
ncbi:MAG: bifunctional diguanylate cyclase/phosphodiesterase [Solirubrobacterales bacterium]|nr:bifunctional diguanylate cyclase/phosphodiesterase [Solirubrobacterales bacterium]